MIQNQLTTECKVNAIGEDIGLQKAANEIKNFFDAKGTSEAFVIGRDILVKILAQPSCAGIKIYNAMYDNGNPTLIYLGVDSKGFDLISYSSITCSGTIEENNAIIANRPWVKTGRSTSTDTNTEEFWWDFE